MFILWDVPLKIRRCSWVNMQYPVMKEPESVKHAFFAKTNQMFKLCNHNIHTYALLAKVSESGIWIVVYVIVLILEISASALERGVSRCDRCWYNREWTVQSLGYAYLDASLTHAAFCPEVVVNCPHFRKLLSRFICIYSFNKSGTHSRKLS